MSDGNSMPAEPDPKRPRLGDKYDEIDKQINKQVARWIADESNLSDDQIDFLLVTIRAYSDGLISWTDIQEVFNNHPDLKDQLQAAWKEKSYRKILQLAYLQSSSGSVQPTTSSLETARQTRYLAETEKLLREAWKKPFQGDYHLVLQKKIEAMYEAKPYKNICAIVQSSGTGKSRMVDELAKLVYTLPINIRRRVGTYATYPPPDDVLRAHLQHAPEDEPKCRTYYETFFQCLFSHSLEELSKLNPSGNGLARDWYDRMDDAVYRRNFYETVVRLSKSPIGSQSALKDLRTKLEKDSTNKRIQMVIYIDEAHELKETCLGGRAKLDVMCSVISDFCKEPLFCLLLSTQFLLHFLAPTREATSSERARESTGLLAPITETAFDCSPDLMIKSGVLRVEDLSTLERVAMWGRPLWSTMVDVGADELVKTARMKLLCCHDIDSSYHDVWKSALVAVLDVLLAFDFQPTRELNEDIQASLVASHMRTAYSVPQHRMYFQSGYPSEPLLAEAAAQQVFKFQQLDGGKSPDIMVDMLQSCALLNSTLIDAGQRGEVLMRMCLMRAYMDGVLQDLGRDPGKGIIFSKGCKLTTFIKQLFEPRHAKTVLNAKPDNLESDQTFSQAFAGSIVRFMHFAKAGDEDAMTSEALFGAFARGMAFIGYQTQQAVDFAIPVLLNKEDFLKESAMSAILIQVKKRVRGRGSKAYTFSEEDVGLFPQGEGEGEGKEKNDERPYVILVAEVGIEPEVGKVKGIKTPTVHVSQQPELISDPDIHPRYAIVAYGCTGVYKHMTEDKRAFLLATRMFAAEHPHYQVPESRDLMMRLKPIWQHGENSYHWLDSTKLRQPKQRGAQKG